MSRVLDLDRKDVMTEENIKPRVRFCWECGRKLRGNYFVEVKFEGHNRIMHKQCWKWLQWGIRDAES